MTTALIPYPGTTVCGCDEDAACSFHAASLYTRPTEQSEPPTDDRDWTPEDEDDMEHDRKIVDDMREEAQSNPDMALALRMLFSDDIYSHADYIRDTKQDAKVSEDYCACNSCAESNKWYNQ